MAGALDHAVINVLQRMDEAVERFRVMGFTLTERGYHSLGSINHLMVFDRDYLELVGIESGAQTVRRDVADSPMGLNGLVFDTDDARGLHRRLSAADIPVLPPVDFDRPVELNGCTQRAAFTTVRLGPDFLAGGRVYFCEHKTPHLVWRREWQRHQNAALGLAHFTIVVPDPVAEADRYRRLLGCDAQACGVDQVELPLGAFRIVLCSVARYRSRYGSLGCSDSRTADGTAAARPTFMGALAIRTASLARLRECLARPEASEVIWENSHSEVVVSSSSAYDCVVEFVD